MLAIIGGSGLTQLANLAVERREVVRTPHGEPSGPLTFGRLCGQPAVFIARQFNFQPMTMFDVGEDTRKTLDAAPPQIKF